MSQFNLNITCLILLVFIILRITGGPAYGTEEEGDDRGVSVGMILPKIELPPPGSEKDQQYLGLKDLEAFSFSAISSKLIVLEIFSVYCPHCRMQAPKLNKLYNLIHHEPELSSRIKIIGIATARKQC